MIALRDHIERSGPKTPGALVQQVSLDRPIAFNDQMVRALLAGRKTQTRRPLTVTVASEKRGVLFDRSGKQICCPLTNLGDRLWVRERWAKSTDPSTQFDYAADSQSRRMRWQPAFRMPIAAARTWLSVRAVQVARLQEISEHDAAEEGFDPIAGADRPREWFRTLWNSIYGDAVRNWDANPWVWVIRFEVLPSSPSPRTPGEGKE